jgi:chromosome segregation ATPase
MSALVELVAATVGGGLVTGVVDRVRYRRKPGLDVAALAQQVAKTTMEHAQAEIDRTWAAAELRVQAAEDEVKRIREELAELTRLRGEVATLRARLDEYDRAERRSAREIEDLRTKLAAAQADSAAKQNEIDRLRGLTEHAQNQLGASAAAPAHSAER